MEAGSLGIVFVAGLVTFFSGCVIPVIPVFISTLLGSIEDQENQKALKIGKISFQIKPILRVTMFILGLMVTYMLISLVFSSIGAYILPYRRIIMIVLGAFVVVFGIIQTGLVRIPFLMREKRVELKKQRKGLLGAFLLGFSFSFGWSPCLAAGFFVVAGGVLGQDIWLSLLVSLIFVIGFIIPFLILTIFSSVLLDKMKFIYKHMRVISIVGGILMIIMGILLMLDLLHIFIVS